MSDAARTAKFSADGTLIYTLSWTNKEQQAADGTVLGGRSPAINTVSSRSGETLKSVDLKFDFKYEFGRKLCLGQNRYFAVAGTGGYPGGFLALFDANSNARKLTPLWTKPVAESTAHLEFSANEMQFLVSYSNGYEILDSATGTVVDKFNSKARSYAISLSPENSRVLSVDDYGIVLRDRATNRALPKLGNLPWGQWRIAVTDKFVINREWTRCLSTGHRIDDAGNSVPAIYCWQVDKPIGASQ